MWGVARAVTMRHSASRPRDGRTEPFDFLVPQFTTITDLRPRPLPPRGHKHRRRSDARRRISTRPMRNGPTLSKSSFFFAYWLARFFSLSTLLIDIRTNDLLFFHYFDKEVKTLRGQTPSSKGRNKTNSTRHLLRRPIPRFHD